MGLDSSTAQRLQQIFSVEHASQLPKDYLDKVEEYVCMNRGTISGGVPHETLIFLALSMPRHHQGFDGGDVVHVNSHCCEATYVRPAPCGFAFCNIRGEMWLVKLADIKAVDNGDLHSEEDEDLSVETPASVSRARRKKREEAVAV